ncbi:MAG: hypothetical protein JXO22_03015 [Phycisphaerae bacterium]|nr:hypothetical protein [Phycisphaerae bacterium]
MTTLTPRLALTHDAKSSGDRDAGGGHMLDRLAAIWLLGCVDLRMSILAVRYDLLDAYSEHNPLAALMLSMGVWALVLYKILLSVGGSVALVAYRHQKLARHAAVWLLLAYALVTLKWAYFYGICVPFRERAPHFGCFCAAVSEMWCLLLVAIVGLSMVTLARMRGDRAATIRVAKRRKRWPFRSRTSACVALAFLLMPLSCFPDHPRQARGPEQSDGTVDARECWISDGRLWRMNTDESDRTRSPAGLAGEPSRAPLDRSIAAVLPDIVVPRADASCPQP